MPEEANYEKLFLGLTFMAFLSGLFTITLFLISSGAPSSDITASPTPDTSLKLESEVKSSFSQDLGDIITPTPQAELDLNIQITPTPSPKGENEIDQDANMDFKLPKNLTY